MDSVTPLIALSFVTFTLVSALRFARGRDWNGVLTIVVVWLGGFISAWVFAESTIGQGLVLPLTGGVPLGLLSLWDLLILGLVVGSTATTVNEFRGALDNSASTTKPRLLSGNTVTVFDNAVVVDPPPPTR